MERGLLSSNAHFKGLCSSLLLSMLEAQQLFLPGHSIYCLQVLLTLQDQERFIHLILTSHTRSFWQIGSKGKISGSLGKFATALIFLEHHHEMLPHSGFCCFTFSHCGEWGCPESWKSRRRVRDRFCPCRASSLDRCDNWSYWELIPSRPLHREPWSSEKEGDVHSGRGATA